MERQSRRDREIEPSEPYSTERNSAAPRARSPIGTAGQTLRPRRSRRSRPAQHSRAGNTRAAVRTAQDDVLILQRSILCIDAFALYPTDSIASPLASARTWDVATRETQTESRTASASRIYSAACTVDACFLQDCAINSRIRKYAAAGLMFAVYLLHG